MFESVTTFIGLAGQALAYMRSVRDYGQAKRDAESELATLYSIVVTLKNHIETSSRSDVWNTALRTLDAANGPLAQLRSTLEEFVRVIDKPKVKGALRWPWDKDKVKTDIIEKSERLKSNINVILSTSV